MKPLTIEARMARLARALERRIAEGSPPAPAPTPPRQGEGKPEQNMEAA